MGAGPLGFRALPLTLLTLGASDSTLSSLVVDGEYLDCDNGERFQLLPALPVSSTSSQGFPASVESCSWHAVEGAAFLPGHADGLPTAAGSLSTAKAHCISMGNVCAGITLQPCKLNRVVLYSLRAEADPQASPQGETSWLKVCDETADLPVVAHELAGPPGIAGCSDESFVALRAAAIEFYSKGVVSVNLLLYMGTVLRYAASSGGWNHVAASCAPGALQALILRIEERLFVDETERANLEAVYFDLLHDVLLTEDVTPAGLSSWPLAGAWSRVSKLRHQASLGPARPEKDKSVDFVLCFCSVAKSPGGGYPAIEDELGWLAELLEPKALEHRHRTRIFVKEKCSDAARHGFEDFLRAALLPYAEVVEIHRVDDDLRADDATAYLDHLAGAHYDDLAAWTFFLHADAPEHIHPFRLLEEVVSAALAGTLDQATFPFLYLSHNYLDLGTSKFTWDDYASPKLWRNLFGGSFSPPRQAVKGYCCVQFLVPRRQALLRKRSWYAQALKYFASQDSYFDLFPSSPRQLTWQDHTCRTPAQLWMPWWHVVFGEDLTYPERHHDPRLPLFLQLRSIPPDRIHCC